jgi:WD40 repeat protein
MQLHKVMIKSLAFSGDEQYLASIGGQDDNQIVTWDVSEAPWCVSCLGANWQAALRPPLRKQRGEQGALL